MSATPGAQRDTSNFEWIGLNFELYIYAPIYIQLCYNYDNIPKNGIQSSFQIPVTHHYKTEYFTFTVNIP